MVDKQKTNRPFKNKCLILPSKNQYKMYYKVKTILFSICAIISISSCNLRNQEKESFILAEKTLPCMIQCGDEQADSLPVLDDDIISQFLPFLKKFEGQKPVLKTPLPSEWKVEYKIENLSPDFDIWIVSNLHEVTHKVLITIKELETGYEVISGVWIAYSVANEGENYIESEEWIGNIDEEYMISIKKQYEKIHSTLNDSIPPANFLQEKEDVYQISLNGTIVYQQPEIYETDYMAVVQFADTTEKGIALDEDWIWNSIHMQEVLEENNILFIEATHDFDKISILNYRGEEVDKINLSGFLATYSKGYFFLKKGQTPVYHRYCEAKICLEKALPYFGIIADSTENISKNE